MSDFLPDPTPGAGRNPEIDHNITQALTEGLVGSGGVEGGFQAGEAVGGVVGFVGCQEEGLVDGEGEGDELGGELLMVG